MTHRDPRQSHPARPRPLWVLKAVGVWGTGRRSKIKVDDVRIVDLAAPPGEGEGEGSISGGSLVVDICESADVEASDAGLDIALGTQIIEHLDERMSVVRNVE